MRDRPLYYVLDDDGVPLAVDDAIIWADWFMKIDRRVALDYVGLSRVSTVFLGVDHAFGDGAPLLFETMIFADDESKLDLACWRYSTRAEALAGHADALAALRARVAP
jgi:hypothetical protein